MDNYAGGGSDRSRKRGRDESKEESASGSKSESGSEVNHQSVGEMEAEVDEIRAEYNRMRAKRLNTHKAWAPEQGVRGAGTRRLFPLPTTTAGS